MVTSDPREVLLARFERLIDLPAFLGQRGYEATGPTNPAGLTMTNSATGDSLVLRKDLVRGSWSYTNPRDPSDHGAIAAYLARRDHLSPNACLDRIVACLDIWRTDDPEALRYRGYARGQPTPLGPAVAAYLKAADHEHRATKALERVGVLRGSLDEWRFEGMKTEAEVARALREPQRDLWASKHRLTDRCLVLTERPIDAMSFAQTSGNQTSRYLATGSRLEEHRKDRIRAVLTDLPSGMSVVLAFGRDEQGRRLAEEVQALAPKMKMERAAPAFGARWNDQVQLERRHARSIERLGPSRA